MELIENKILDKFQPAFGLDLALMYLWCSHTIHAVTKIFKYMTMKENFPIDVVVAT